MHKRFTYFSSFHFLTNKSLSLLSTNLPLLDFELLLAARRISAAPDFEAVERVGYFRKFDLLEPAVYGNYGVARVGAGAQAERIAAHRRVQVQQF